jgi:hypothetical protein
VCIDFLTPSFLPGTKPFLLYKGRFSSSPDPCSALFLVSDGRSPLTMKFQKQEIADGIISLNAQESTFKLMFFDGCWQLHGCHPRVLGDPAVRPFSKKYAELQEERKMKPDIIEEVLLSASDASELLRKASESSSNSTSSSKRATVGPVSLITSFTCDADSILYSQLHKEMRRNSLIMDKVRYFYMTILLLQNTMSRFVDVESTADVLIESKCCHDSSLAVCFRVD